MPKIKKDYIGKRFGRLVVTDKYKQKRRTDRKSSRTFWLCKCDCGEEKWLDIHLLRNGNTRSCGCLRSESQKIEPGRSSQNRLFRRYKRDAKRHNRVFNLSFEEFINLTTQECFYCGLPPSTVQKADGNNGDFIYNGIDRIDNEKGYEKDNCVSCCKTCNQAKYKLKQINFISWVKRTYCNLEKKGALNE